MKDQSSGFRPGKWASLQKWGEKYIGWSVEMKFSQTGNWITKQELRSRWGWLTGKAEEGAINQSSNAFHPQILMHYKHLQTLFLNYFPRTRVSWQLPLFCGKIRAVLWVFLLVTCWLSYFINLLGNDDDVVNAPFWKIKNY